MQDSWLQRPSANNPDNPILVDDHRIVHSVHPPVYCSNHTIIHIEVQIVSICNFYCCYTNSSKFPSQLATTVAFRTQVLENPFPTSANRTDRKNRSPQTFQINPTNPSLNNIFHWISANFAFFPDSFFQNEGPVRIQRFEWCRGHHRLKCEKAVSIRVHHLLPRTTLHLIFT